MDVGEHLFADAVWQRLLAALATVPYMHLNNVNRLHRHLWFERIVTSADSADLTEPITPELQGILDSP